MIKAVIFNFNGVIINSESIHQQLIEEILLEENLVLKPGEYQQICLGRSDRVCLRNLLASRGRVVDDKYLTKLLQKKAQNYVEQIERLEKLPLYSGLDDFIFKIRSSNLKLAIVSGTIRQEIELVLDRAELAEYFKIIVAGDDLTTSKPKPDGYLLALERLKQEYPELNLQANECLAVEDTLFGVQAAKAADMKVVGVANTYPFHMLQRQANWTVDYLTELELERIQEIYSPTPVISTTDE
ncbi:HAD family phosphatase [Plectonema cf. radiosum LEGE 06105]|uniref:HAD family phosphatase n=1 Tax=Plectonema cf. radiosum LEGE 06105 TaxID=945769 RepID=A0A8J7FCX5_9CYAN|nr:HAD family phosphatase [Plectonema radiosum]MBE9211961.1 HAD family phosphatase [Plectonema cf. radiosum LEGE 06105]